MDLTRSPEFKSSNTKPSAAELFGTLRPPFEQTQKSSTTQSSIPNHASEPSGPEEEDFFKYFPLYFYASNSGALA